MTWIGFLFRNDPWPLIAVYVSWVVGMWIIASLRSDSTARAMEMQKIGSWWT